MLGDFLDELSVTVASCYKIFSPGDRFRRKKEFGDGSSPDAAV
jgi:hypothetical protein